MGIAEKIANAKETKWISEGISESEAKSIVEIAKISARIESKRIDMGMTQQEFADYMGVSQGMVSKWESRNYNFTIKTLNEICEKLKIDISISFDNSSTKAEYDTTKWNGGSVKTISTKKWIPRLVVEEAIA